MQTVRLRLKKHSYNIIIGKNILPRAGSFLKPLKLGNDAYVITNPAIAQKYGKLLNKSLSSCGFKARFRMVPDSEKAKSIRIAASVIKDLAAADTARKTFIIAFGGGVIGDLSGFIASIYKRGIPYVQIPTTLLAQVDSAIGGKTGIDLLEGKNLVGAFYQPRLVISDSCLLKSLHIRQMRAGLAEVIKYGAIKDAKLFSYLEDNHTDIFNHDPDALEYIVERCSKIKADIVSKDEREEKGIRTVLNFGHTIGHAIEAASNYAHYNHGEAVGLGMLVAASISKRLKLADNKTISRIRHLIDKTGLPVKIKEVSPKRIVEAHYRDKKFIGRKNRFVLVTNIGRTKVAENIPLETIVSAIKENT